MTVLSVAFANAPVGADAVGGAERILSDLDRALVEQGHVSLVAACEGSKAAGELFTGAIQAVIDRALASRRVDLIHLHGLDFHQWQWPAEIPAVVTLHLPIDWYPPDIWRRYTPGTTFVCVSETQRRSCPPELRDCPVIVNGVEAPAYAAAATREFALVLGRICPEKNQHAALEAAALAGIPALLGGQVFPYAAHEAYFREQIEPLLAPGRAEFLGPLTHARKWELLSRARCLLHPTQAPETSSLVAMEALAAGAPVIAYPSGALAEIVEHGVTGFLVHNVKEMAEAIARTNEISPGACREAASKRFAARRMIREYLDLYRRLTHG